MCIIGFVASSTHSLIFAVWLASCVCILWHRVFSVLPGCSSPDCSLCFTCASPAFTKRDRDSASVSTSETYRSSERVFWGARPVRVVLWLVCSGLLAVHYRLILCLSLIYNLYQFWYVHVPVQLLLEVVAVLSCSMVSLMLPHCVLYAKSPAWYWYDWF